MTTSAGGDVTLGMRMEETMPVGLTRILLDRKIKKMHAVDLVGTNGQ
jgi:hypothetical protein